MASQSLTLPNLARKYNYTCIYRTPLTTYRKSKRVKGGEGIKKIMREAGRGKGEKQELKRREDGKSSE